MYTVIKKGPDDWEDLFDKDISFEWSDGWEGYNPRFVLRNISTYAEDPRYPRYYLLDENFAGYSFWADDEVKVTVHD